MPKVREESPKLALIYISCYLHGRCHAGRDICENAVVLAIYNSLHPLSLNLPSFTLYTLRHLAACVCVCVCGGGWIIRTRSLSVSGPFMFHWSSYKALHHERLLSDTLILWTTPKLVISWSQKEKSSIPVCYQDIRKLISLYSPLSYPLTWRCFHPLFFIISFSLKQYFECHILQSAGTINKNYFPWHCADLYIFKALSRKRTCKSYCFFILIWTVRLTISLHAIERLIRKSCFIN